MRNRAVAQAMLDPKARHRDWSARVRSSAAHALRYSKFVTVMRRALALSAFAVIAAVLIFFFVQRQPQRLQLAYERMGIIQNDLSMIKPRLMGADSKGNSFVITADTSIQDTNNRKRARLKNVQADLAVGNQSWIDATAAKGVVDMLAGTLMLDGGLSVFSDNGYELHTARAALNFKADIVEGPQTVTGHGPLGTLRADRFRVDRGTEQILLTGHVQMLLNPHSNARPKS